MIADLIRQGRIRAGPREGPSDSRTSDRSDGGDAVELVPINIFHANGSKLRFLTVVADCN